MAAARWLLPWIKTQVRISSRSATGYTFPYLRLLEISFEYSGFWESVAHFWTSAWLTPMIAFTLLEPLDSWSPKASNPSSSGGKGLWTPSTPLDEERDRDVGKRGEEIVFLQEVERVK